MKPPVIDSETSYTFVDYFHMTAEVEDILAYFGYSFQAHDCALAHSTALLPSLADLKERIAACLPYISLTSEIARREFLIAPVLLEVIQYTQVKVKVEYPIGVSNLLKGTLDYYLQSQNSFLIIEAKQGDLQKGFTQLAVELVALDQWTDSTSPQLYGAASLGDIWQFGFLNRSTKQVTQDLNLYRVPADLEELVSIIVAILTNAEGVTTEVKG